MNLISDITRQDLLDIIKDGFVERYDEPVFDGDTGEFIYEQHVFMPYFGRLDEIGFLSRIYDLEALPSTDRRYRNALGDITCHLRFNDYNDDWVFQDRRFKLLHGDGDEPILRFICEMLHPAVRKADSPWKAYLDKFNEILQNDGYELYAAQHISGRDVYKSRLCTQTEAMHLPDALFSVRYKELIQYGNDRAVDNISASITSATKERLWKVMHEFAEPMKIQRSRYDNWTDNTDAVSEAIRRLNAFIGFTAIETSFNVFSPCSSDEILSGYFTPFVLDVIEFQYDELSSREKAPFQEAINDVFRKDNLAFRLSDRGLIELIVDQEVLSSEIIEQIQLIQEPGVRDLLTEAIEKHMQPSLQSHRDAVEKIWDALERLKTYYTTMDKKGSAARIVDDMAHGDPVYHNLFESEFATLTRIGNDFRIRHHETTKIEISDPRHFDYFFNRCLSLISLAIQYLQ